MNYSDEEYNFLCVMLAAFRDGMMRHEGFKDLAEHLDVLGTAVFREEELTASMLKAIKKTLIFSFCIFSPGPDASGEITESLQELRQKTLLRTIAMLKEREQEQG